MSEIQTATDQNNSDDNYIPYGEQWVKEIATLPKSAIIQMLKRTALERDYLRQELQVAREQFYMYAVNG